MTNEEQCILNKALEEMAKTPMGVVNNFLEQDYETLERYRRLECLKMAVQHATAEQVQTGQVYKIAGDYYNYVMGE